MLNVIKNETAKKFMENPTEYVGIIKTNGYNVMLETGNDENEVRESLRVRWAVMWDYEGNPVVIEANGVNIKEA